MLCWRFENPEPIKFTYQQNKVDISGNYFIPLTLCAPALQGYVNCPDCVQKKRKKSPNVLITKTEADRAKLFILLQMKMKCFENSELINSSDQQHKVDIYGNYIYLSSGKKFIPKQLILKLAILNLRICSHESKAKIFLNVLKFFLWSPLLIVLWSFSILLFLGANRVWKILN